MSEIGAYEAKTHLSEILERVRKGECFTITKHGQAVAELRPPMGQGLEERRAAVARMKVFQASHDLGGVSLRELIDAGRKY
ncbi:type II toxin-antitoxin system prevent-host-death family antitoxin [Acidithiobacillus sp. 'AMD consortium']|jgi:antitoxin (DNA-binding transcriptional repressor) of toxin-antitoxin stability system|uniref:Antitoxin n=2 Tax=Acidithiobacillus ferridurans TaxID=1232575 RepID=A0A2Z6IN13_ACIFI|nr:MULTISPECIES: type II toxin-antitoxin system prevent-host-death family antitoxin [Acidithiobacillus]MCL5051748.1 type II toxin-antitoxin system prevent-host-death family antitoxin [Gammaproteobacteria bacterium]MBU2715888.1 type II toxin-antitoxin system prevent-host-death family antitoxin [Acidithiobacillus ferridurans]MBU2720823.1 type II toxin-antitoxin system prevent-host-death family antitoxin [Acidithiobacillus ferridurans]MBU2724624.1 type II toxin-antitoxin system prevent-host-death 